MSSSFLSVLIQRQAGKYGDRVALRYRDYKTETWIPVSWNQFAATVKTVSNALIELGIGIQENIAVFSQNKPECLYVDFGAFGVRAVTVPFYATSSEGASAAVKKIAEFNDKLKFEPVGNPVEMKHSMKAETNTQAKELAKAMADRLKADRK